ncbi:MAG TPA: hypothetical protein VKM55_25775 [Candidatus Lokiarchaeia archaeon]|nr:hypothetical protein [Candidatus Lokiarchaeia archaeon]
MKGETEIATIGRELWAIRDTYGIRIDSSVPNEEALDILAWVIVLHYTHLAAASSSGT